MKKIMAAAIAATLTAGIPASASTPDSYVPSPEIVTAQQEFADNGFGIFLHWGIYSLFGQGEWYLNYGASAEEYAKSAKAFYPADFNAAEWVKAFKDAGAKYITFTTRHHDGFSMFATRQSDYNIVDATPFKRDILKELADECEKQGLKLHLYYSHIDWTRPDYPSGRTGLKTGRDTTLRDWPSYYKFMNNQLTELLTNYGKIGAIWFDGKWDHDQDSTSFDWQLPEQYALIHRLQPGTLIANNHHETPYPGEDFQIFERDLPGQNEHGLSGQDVSQLPLETCATMNGMWGYKIMDQNYKSVPELIELLVNARGKGANLLLNIGPQPTGALPAAALDRLKGMGEWLRANGETVYGVRAADFPAQSWGTATRKGDKLYLHVFRPEGNEITVPTALKIKSAKEFATKSTLKHSRLKERGVKITLPEIPQGTIDYIIELETK